MDGSGVLAVVVASDKSHAAAPGKNRPRVLIKVLPPGKIHDLVTVFDDRPVRPVCKEDLAVVCTEFNIRREDDLVLLVTMH